MGTRVNLNLIKCFLRYLRVIRYLLIIYIVELFLDYSLLIFLCINHVAFNYYRTLKWLFRNAMC